MLSWTGFRNVFKHSIVILHLLRSRYQKRVSWYSLRNHEVLYILFLKWHDQGKLLAKSSNGLFCECFQVELISARTYDLDTGNLNNLLTTVEISWMGTLTKHDMDTYSSAHKIVNCWWRITVLRSNFFKWNLDTLRWIYDQASLGFIITQNLVNKWMRE